jgi:hypothetical protein
MKREPKADEVVIWRGVKCLTGNRYHGLVELYNLRSGYWCGVVHFKDIEYANIFKRIISWIF